jgi:error-prone DNA polymerase
MAGPAEFAHLHVASSFSLRYGTATPSALAARAAGLGMSALALTDRDGLYGAFKHVQACADAGIKPLLGADLGLRADHTSGINRTSRVTLLAAGRQGWASLCRLVSAAHASAEAQAEAQAQAQAEAAHHSARVVHLGEADSHEACGARLAPTAARLLDR